MKVRTVDRTGTKMIFVRHGRQLRVSQWISAVEDYNKEAPVHLKIHWAGSTETEHIRQSEGHSRLSISHAYKYILQKDNTYMEWATVSLSGKGPLKPFVDAPGDPSGASSKRNPKRVYENMNVDKIYRDMNIDPESPKHKHARAADHDTESDDEVLEPVQPRVVPLVDVPAMVINKVQAPVVNEVQAPVVNEVQAPAPIINEAPILAPDVNEVQAPVINEVPPQVINEPQPPPQVNNPQPGAEQHVTGDLVSLAVLKIDE